MCCFFPHQIPVCLFPEDVLDKVVGDKRHFVTTELEVRPVSGERTVTKPIIEYAQSVIEVLPKELQEAIENGITNSCVQGKESAITATLVQLFCRNQFSMILGRKKNVVA